MKLDEMDTSTVEVWLAFVVSVAMFAFEVGSQLEVPFPCCCTEVESSVEFGSPPFCRLLGTIDFFRLKMRFDLRRILKLSLLVISLARHFTSFGVSFEVVTGSIFSFEFSISILPSSIVRDFLLIDSAGCSMSGSTLDSSLRHSVKLNK